MIVVLAGRGHAADLIVPRAGKPGPPMLLGTSVMSSNENQIAKSLGFSHEQTDSDHLTVNEVQPGHWDWTNADAGLAAMQQAGMEWQYFPHFHWAPEWYRKTAKFVPSTGLRTRRKLAAMSLWSPDIVPWFDHCYAALAEHYGSGGDKLFAIYLGIHGDFGETIFPMGFHPDEKKYFGPNGVAVPDFWCGDEYAQKDFRQTVKHKYRSIGKLNAAWGTGFTNFDEINYPPAALKDGVAIGNTSQERRYWLDFVQWYYDSMTRWTGEVCRIARHYFPNALLQIPIGGGSEKIMFGQDTTALPKIAGRYGVDVRSTHGGYASFPMGYASMIKRIATPCKIYGVPHWLEPPSTISADGEVSRIMEALSCGNRGFWDWGGNPMASPNVFREYTNFFTQEKPVVDVALFFPTTDHRLHPAIDYPLYLQAVGTHLRDVMDFDIVDEELMADDALKHYRVLVWIEGQVVEERTLKTIAAWVRKGGVLVRWGAEAPQTVEGETAMGSALLGLIGASANQKGGPLEIRDRAFLRHLSAHANSQAASSTNPIDRKAMVLATVADRPAVWAMPHGKGWVVVAERGEQPAFEELVRDVTYNLSKLDASKTDALEVDTAWDGVYATLLSNDEVILHNFNSTACSKTVCGTTVTLPPKSLRSVLVKAQR